MKLVVQFCINKQMNCIVFPMDFAICVSDRCVSAYIEKDILCIRQNFQGLHLKQQYQQQQQKSAYNQSCSKSERARKCYVHRKRKIEIEVKIKNEREIFISYSLYISHLYGLNVTQKPNHS